MNKINLLFISFLFVINTYSQNKKVKNLKQEYLQIAEKLFMAKYETSYGEYFIFLDSLKKNNENELYFECYIDTLQLKKDSVLPYFETNKAPKIINNYPISMVSFKAAEAYCKWITNKYNLNPDRTFKNVLFRLPNEIEWELAASGGITYEVYPWAGGPFVRGSNGKYLCNFLKIGEANISYDVKNNKYIVVPQGRINTPFLNYYLKPINDYFPNRFGLYNMSGNVAEMISESGIAKGGGYNDPGYDVRIKSFKKYTNKSKDIGFRVLMEVVQE